jgi:redox-sensitive bicupin YhaK (pirin superfamily)
MSKMLPDPNTRPDPNYRPEWAAPLPSGTDDEGAEFSLPPGKDSRDAPLSPLRRMRRGETGGRVG